jgi:DNA end-binding protein Ku
MKVIRAKRKGQEIHRAPEVEEEGPADLMAALRQSLEAAQGGRKPRRRARTNEGSASNGLNNLSKAELDKRAKKADIPGRSSMSKDELAEALAKAS